MIACSSLSCISSCYLYLLVIFTLLHFCLSNQIFGDVLCMDVERQALIEFKHDLIDESDRLASWVDGSNCCKWAGIVCDNITGHIHHVHLPGLDGHCDYFSDGHRLRGNISSSLLSLKQLEHLDLSCNDFEGIQVPSFIGSLSNLRYLNLSYSKFSGIVPPQLGNLSALNALSLGGFGYEIGRSSVMNMNWLSSLRLLRHLDMNSVDLSKATDWFQVINTLPSLIELRLYRCELTDIHLLVPSLNLTSLTILDLSENNFNSSVPRWLFSITSLVSLDLNRCNFHGDIPSTTYSFRNLTSLESLYVSENSFMNSSLVLDDLSSTIGSNLVSLGLTYCGISSSVLDSLYNLTSLQTLFLLGNQITKTIPKSLGNLCNLREIRLEYNDFRNISLTDFLESFTNCKMPRLESLSLSQSNISGHLPDQLGKLIHLKYLELDYNLIVGTIPDSIGQLSSMIVLRLTQNQISGPIPFSIERLSSLETLNLSDNKLNGSIPDSLGQLSNLTWLDFSNNLLTGVVTEAHFEKLVNLKYLNGEGNNLTLRLRIDNWVPPFQLESLNLNSWVLGPQFPSWLQLQKNLIELDISNTQISESVPKSFWRSLPRISILDMSKNRIQGTLSNGSFPYYLDLSGNSFEGSLDQLMCSNGVKETQALILGNNNLSGVIPECWDKWPSLVFLNLENNGLSGTIPTTLGSLSRLQSLNIRGNKISGKLPDSLMNLRSLGILQLGRNELVGTIPTWIGTELTSLRLLNLRSNNFDGNIPQELCYLRSIQILYLADNNLVGNIPRCFNNFSVLSGEENISPRELRFSFAPYVQGIETIASDLLVMKGREDVYSTNLKLVMLLDFSSNNLVGNIPSELTALVMLKSLNLSRNQLTGMIPEKIGEMKLLETFDVSLNELSGELPVSLSSLSFLSNFNVSYNNLTGRVPLSTQLQSFNESCFLGNKLCGDPLFERCSVKVSDTEDENEEDGSQETDWVLIISTLSGLIVGFWIVVTPLIVSRSWRITYFRFFSELRNKFRNPS